MEEIIKKYLQFFHFIVRYPAQTKILKELDELIKCRKEITALNKKLLSLSNND